MKRPCASAPPAATAGAPDGEAGGGSAGSGCGRACRPRRGAGALAGVGGVPIRPRLRAARRGSTADLPRALRAAELVRVGPDGTIWYISPDGTNGTYSVGAESLEGVHEVFAEGLAEPLYLQASVGRGGEAVLVDSFGAIRRLRRGAGMSVLDENASAASVEAYEGGLLSMRHDGEGKTIERRDHDGAVLETLVLPFKVPPYFAVGAGGKELIYSAQTSLHKVDLVTKEQMLIAGHCKRKGCEDGHAVLARFNKLKLPRYHAATNSIFVRDERADSTSRFCNVDLATFCVTTWDVEHLQNVRSAATAFPHLVALLPDGDLYHADMRDEISRSTFSRDMSTVDWSEQCSVEFRLAGGTALFADRRVLSARSPYFAAMFRADSDLCEARSPVVDLSGSPVDVPAFQAVLAFLATDELQLVLEEGGAERPGASEDAPLSEALACLSVAALADQYQAARLVLLAEARLLRGLLPGRDALVLPLLERTFGSGGAVERACWKALVERPVAVLGSLGDAEVEAILERAPRLRVALLRRLASELGSLRG